MNLRITRRQRALLLFLSASGYTAWFSGLGDRIEARGLGNMPGTTFSVLPEAAAPRVASLIVRDPFAGGPVARERGPADATSEGGSSPSATVLAARDAVGSDGRAGGATDTVVPNIDAGATGQTLTATQTLVVRATIVGTNAVAYVANGTLLDIVRVGDTLADRRITKIDLHGIVFNDGTRLDLPDSFTATPRPHAANGKVTLNVDDLRRLLAPQAVPRTPSPAAGAAKAAPQPSPAPTYPSPGPLPSVNTNGLPVGVNPTSDPGNPTPYPYPYPYAPPAR